MTQAGHENEAWHGSMASLGLHLSVCWGLHWSPLS